MRLVRRNPGRDLGFRQELSEIDIKRLGESVGVFVADGEELASGGYDLGSHGSQVIALDGEGKAPAFWRQDVSAADSGGAYGERVLREPLLMLARSERVKDLVTRLPVSSAIVNRYVPGERAEDAVRAGERLVADGLRLTFDHLGEDTLDEAQAEATVDAYLGLLEELSAAGLTRHAEVSVKLSAIGQALPDIGPKLSLENARRICRAARNAGTTVTLDMEDHTTTDQTLATLHELRKDYPETGAVLQAYLRRTEADCRALAHEGSRVRLCKGAYNEPEAVAYAGIAGLSPGRAVLAAIAGCFVYALAGRSRFAIVSPTSAKISGSAWSASKPAISSAPASTLSPETNTACAPRSASQSRSCNYPWLEFPW